MAKQKIKKSQVDDLVGNAIFPVMNLINDNDNMTPAAYQHKMEFMETCLAMAISELAMLNGDPDQVVEFIKTRALKITADRITALCPECNPE